MNDWLDMEMDKEQFQIIQEAEDKILKAMFVSPAMLGGNKKDIIKQLAATAVELYENKGGFDESL